MEDPKQLAFSLLEDAKRLLKEGKKDEAKREAQNALNTFLAYLISRGRSFPLIPPAVELNSEGDIELVERLMKEMASRL